ncbi:uncharacterized protein BP01DRAFT_213378 [Aspergillus saccharolyticus JOP 1030-1]|uniref:Uncharacterized protein n=1 Tax=Aspergillus saccharolyticus JOP 1030-1 TaxID=1450539 RepID=A0A318ZSI3_9EURO|nr:hypothetical protein BP01DRAFT_213378 [Aspergillus saccharolyticus JOP 1030-1]PYH47323.1 hypothetical protein BP01DRAFT_213378 [Aspergillus saccharolyticus JOP 1030-1]
MIGRCQFHCKKKRPRRRQKQEWANPRLRGGKRWLTTTSQLSPGHNPLPISNPAEIKTPYLSCIYTSHAVIAIPNMSRDSGLRSKTRVIGRLGGGPERQGELQAQGGCVEVGEFAVAELRKRGQRHGAQSQETTS